MQHRKLLRQIRRKSIEQLETEIGTPLLKRYVLQQIVQALKVTRLRDVYGRDFVERHACTFKKGIPVECWRELRQGTQLVPVVRFLCVAVLYAQPLRLGHLRLNANDLFGGCLSTSRAAHREQVTHIRAVLFTDTLQPS